MRRSSVVLNTGLGSWMGLPAAQKSRQSWRLFGLLRQSSDRAEPSHRQWLAIAKKPEKGRGGVGHVAPIAEPKDFVTRQSAQGDGARQLRFSLAETASERYVLC